MSESPISAIYNQYIASTTPQCRRMHSSAIQSLDAQVPPMPARSMPLLLPGDAGDIYYNSLCGHAHISPPFTFEILFQNSRKKILSQVSCAVMKPQGVVVHTIKYKNYQF